MANFDINGKMVHQNHFIVNFKYKVVNFKYKVLLRNAFPMVNLKKTLVVVLVYSQEEKLIPQ